MTDLKRTPLFSTHQELKARIVDFAGWEMPIQYTGILAEHRHTRTKVSLFDVSHMGEIFLSGKDALKNVQKLTTNDAAQLALGQVQYSALLNPEGNFIDDITVYRLGEENYQLCVNASNIDKDFSWIEKNIEGDVLCENRSEKFGQIALQGPLADTVLQKVTKTDLKTIQYYWCAEGRVAGCDVLIARMGYTGEKGFEIFCKAEDTEAIWTSLMENGKDEDIQPVGLGARDTLRMEVCFPLYGNDISENHNPFEAGLGWITKMKKDDFIGKSALLKVKEEGINRSLVKFSLTEKGVPRSDYSIFDEEGKEEIGVVTSGTSSPMLGKGVGMGYVKLDWTKPNTKITIRIRKRFVSAVIEGESFVKSKR
ncbi:MAG: aminomethyltransferase [bacterium]|jgi:aminomethyltransferase